MPQASIGRRSVALIAAGSSLGLPLVLLGCSNSAERAPEARVARSQPGYGEASRRVIADGGPIPKGGGTFKLGQPYSMGGRWYVPRDEPGYDRTGLGSWYGTDFHGRKTANGEIYDMHALTAAHPTLPLPCYAYVTNLSNNRTVLLRINDRGPYVAGRLIDLSSRAAQLLGTSQRGVAEVRVRFAGYAPLDGNDRRERQFLAAQPWASDGALLASAPARPQPLRAAAPAASRDAFGYGQAPALQSGAPASQPASRPPYASRPGGQVTSDAYSPAASPAATGAGDDAWSFSSYRSNQRRGLGGPGPGSE